MEYFDSLYTECLEEHTPLRRVGITRPPSPWMLCEEIRSLLRQRDKLRKQAHSINSEEIWKGFRAVRNKLKSAIRHAGADFTTNTLSSDKPKDVWRIIHRILKPNQQPLRHDPEKLNAFLASTAETTLTTQVRPHTSIYQLSENLPESSQSQFSLRMVSQCEVLQVLKSLRNDSSTGPNQIPVKFVKMTADIIAGVLAEIINY